ncbi:aminoacyl-tRNA hydrolase [Candidatus Parcubacteria bacterium]|nr:aminoacyl-tRNA hydrolase [Candidatus Parcubacteria bacterium]
MILVVGLGNPGKQFKKTWHNLGVLALEKFAKEENFPPFSEKKELFAQITKKKIKQTVFLLAKPKTFMNESGKTVKKLLEFFKLPPKNMIVLHDDIDILLSQFKISFNKGAGGHKGVQSIIDEIKTKGFWRIRIGSQPLCGKPKDLKEFVLQKIPKEEEKTLKEVFEKIIKKLLEFSENKNCQ